MAQLSYKWSQLPVTALHYVSSIDLLLASQGHNLLLLNHRKRTVLDRQQVFPGSNIHKIVSCKENPTIVVVIGSKSVAKVQIEKHKFILLATETLATDWLLDCMVMTNEKIMLLTAHNRLVTMNITLDNVTNLPYKSPGGLCILYSGNLVPVSGSDCPLVMAGTVMGLVEVWHPEEEKLLHTLSGHDGVIFNVNYDKNSSLIVTTSDDRSSRVWHVRTVDNMSLDCVSDWARSEIVLKHVLYGHVARVFKSLVVSSNGLIVTAGEDGRVVSWRLDTGELVSSCSPCKGSGVWSVVEGEDGQVMAGGGDGSVCLARAGDTDLTSLVVECGVERPRLVRYISQDRVLVVGDEGTLVSCNMSNGENSNLLSDSRLASYCLLEVDKDSDLILLAGITGLVILARLILGSQDRLELLLDSQVIQSKIFAAALLPNSQFLVNGPDGQLSLFRANQGQTVRIGANCLPSSKQPWFTVACQWEQNVVVGDRIGSLHVFSSPLLSLVHSLPRIHKKGVTDLLVLKSCLWSSGRDGTVRRFSRNREGHLMQIQCVVTGYDWVARIANLNIRELVYLVWHGARLLLREISGQSQGPGLHCGGGHRAWDLIVGENQISAVYIKDGNVMRGDVWSAEDLPILSGGHVTRINVVKHIMMGGKDYVLTGGEDTLIKMYDIVEMTCREVGEMRGHLSSVKCLDVVSDDEECVVVSGGGRAELRVWKVSRIGGEVVATSLVSLILGSNGKKKKPWKQLVAESGSGSKADMRVMCVVVRRQQDILIIYAGCSDGNMRTFQCREDGGNYVLEMMREVDHDQHCVLKLESLMSDYLVSGTTGGLVGVWDSEINILHEETLHQSGINCLTIVQDNTKRWHLVTGGDDNSVVVTKLQMTGNQVDSQVVWRTDQGHSAQVTGVSIMTRGQMMTVSVDQRIVLWDMMTGQWRGSKCVSVADVAGLVTWQKEKGEEDICVVVGVGMELLSIER